MIMGVLSRKHSSGTSQADWTVAALGFVVLAGILAWMFMAPASWQQTGFALFLRDTNLALLAPEAIQQLARVSDCNLT